MASRRYSFYDLPLTGHIVPVDVAGALWDFASLHAADFLRGNHTPALIEFARFINNLRTICKWKLRIFLDGMDNVHKAPENERRKKRVADARARGDLSRQVKNTPEYIAKAALICRFFGVDVATSAYEADPTTAHYALTYGHVPITGDSDLLAYGPPGDKVKEDRLSKLVVVHSWRNEIYRVIDLDSNVEEGKLPLFDLFRKHGRIVFQLYAATSGCDFTEHERGIPGLGIAWFIRLASSVEGPLSAKSLARVIWDSSLVISQMNFQSASDVENYLQHIVDIFTRGPIYDSKSNIVEQSGKLIVRADATSLKHMRGELHSRSREAFDAKLQSELDSLRPEHLLHCSVTETSLIRGVSLPAGKTVDQCIVAELRDFIAARGGGITMNRPELVRTAKQYQFLEKQVRKNYVDRHADPNSELFAKFDTSGTRFVGDVLADVDRVYSRGKHWAKKLVGEAHHLFKEGMFDHQFDNIARVAPELKESLIYRESGHVGQSKTQKSIGDAFKRCLEQSKASYHGIAFVPDTNRVIILSKAHASMKTDGKTRDQTEEGERPEKEEYLVLLDLTYDPTEMMEHGHDLGVFVKLNASFCTACVAGQGLCRHRAERLWYQFHYWTEDRLGIDRPCTLGVCGWAPGGKATNSSVRQKIFEQQTVKYAKTFEEQKAKMERGAKRDCTEGHCSKYQLYPNAKKQRPAPGRFRKERVMPLMKLLQKK